MKKKIKLSKKNIIILSIIFVGLILVLIWVIYLKNNTIVFKSTEDVKDDLLEIQSNVKDDRKYEIDNPLYKEDVGVSRETLYIKENASSKIKEAAKGTDVGFETNNKSENGMLIIDTYEGTSAIEYKVLSHTKDFLDVEIYSYKNLCDLSYIMGSIEDKKIVEEGNDQLPKCMIASNTTYTLSSNFEGGTNIAFFLDADKKFISSTTEKTFTTPANARYIKIITENVEDKKDTAISYNLVLGDKPSNEFIFNKAKTSIDVNDNYQNLIPFNTEKSVLYIDGGDIEINYVTK
ncbi:MAG: hypothetical protein J5881_02115 [Clostridia bacterium]|nr:hypothetical protein [Clostridia bacterium]